MENLKILYRGASFRLSGDGTVKQLMLLVSWHCCVTITSPTRKGVRQTECSLVLEGRSIARVAAPIPEGARTVAWANQARI